MAVCMDIATWFLVEKSRVDSHGRETVQVFGLSIPVYSEKQSQNSHEGSAQEGVAEVRNTLLSLDIYRV